jgi:hypothetical protein
MATGKRLLNYRGAPALTQRATLPRPVAGPILQPMRPNTARMCSPHAAPHAASPTAMRLLSKLHGPCMVYKLPVLPAKQQGRHKPHHAHHTARCSHARLAKAVLHICIRPQGQRRRSQQQHRATPWFVRWVVQTGLVGMLVTTCECLRCRQCACHAALADAAGSGSDCEVVQKVLHVRCTLSNDAGGLPQACLPNTWKTAAASASPSRWMTVSITSLALYFSSLDTTVNNTCRASRADGVPALCCISCQPNTAGDMLCSYPVPLACQ